MPVGTAPFCNFETTKGRLLCGKTSAKEGTSVRKAELSCWTRVTKTRAELRWRNARHTMPSLTAYTGAWFTLPFAARKNTSSHMSGWSWLYRALWIKGTAWEEKLEFYDAFSEEHWESPCRKEDCRTKTPENDLRNHRFPKYKAEMVAPQLPALDGTASKRKTVCSPLESRRFCMRRNVSCGRSGGSPLGAFGKAAQQLPSHPEPVGPPVMHEDGDDDEADAQPGQRVDTGDDVGGNQLAVL